MMVSQKVSVNWHMTTACALHVIKRKTSTVTVHSVTISDAQFIWSLLLYKSGQLYVQNSAGDSTSHITQL